jgi:hypothetical protein
MLISYAYLDPFYVVLLARLDMYLTRGGSGGAKGGAEEVGGAGAAESVPRRTAVEEPVRWDLEALQSVDVEEQWRLWEQATRRRPEREDGCGEGRSGSGAGRGRARGAARKRARRSSAQPTTSEPAVALGAEAGARRSSGGGRDNGASRSEVVDLTEDCDGEGEGREPSSPQGCAALASPASRLATGGAARRAGGPAGVVAGALASTQRGILGFLVSPRAVKREGAG